MSIHRRLSTFVVKRYHNTFIFMPHQYFNEKEREVVNKRAVNDENTHFGLFALRDIEKYELIVSEVAKCIYREPHTYTIQRIPVIADIIQSSDGRTYCQTNDDKKKQKESTLPKHLEMHESLLIRYINHSFQPNSAIEFYAGETERVSLRAIKEIKKGEEVFFDYKSTESHLSQPFEDIASGRQVQ